jgi:hypothetical protein
MADDPRIIAYVVKGTDEIVGFFSKNGLMARKADNARVYRDGVIPTWEFHNAATLAVSPHPLDHHGLVIPRTMCWEGASP